MDEAKKRRQCAGEENLSRAQRKTPRETTKSSVKGLSKTLSVLQM